MRKKFASGRYAAWIVLFIFVLGLPFTAAGQKQKKAKGDAASDANAVPLISGSISDEIDHAIGEMLGAFQVGDVEAMHKYYAENATFVSGAFEPPLMGWAKYLPDYQRERAAFPSMQLLRKNTFIFNNGNVAWASYQWEFLSRLNGRPYSAEGQTTLVFNKVGSNWLIVHNHTSEICPANTTHP